MLPQNAGPKVQKGSLPAPRAGWVQNAAILEPPPYAAEVLDNIFPTAAGARMRRGRNKHATIAGAVTQIMSYRSVSAKLFAADAGNVYDITSPADPDVSPSADISSLTGGDWSYVNFGTSGGNFLWMVNGSDSARHYNGTTWATPAITGVASADLTQTWVFGSRIWGVEKETLSAWYLPADSIAGAMTEYPLRTVFSEGGTLLFGTSWSLDSGEGLDDVCVFVTSEGEVAVYEGSDPSSASTFAKVGTYSISKPLSKHAFFKAGGDVAILTEDGIVSLAAAVQQDRSAVSRNAITYPIEDAWREAVTLRSASHKFNSVIWHSRQMLFVSVPEDFEGNSQAFVCNVRTGAWCRFTGFDMQCSGVSGDQVYFGTSGGEVFAAEQTGADAGLAYTASWLPKFQPKGTVVSLSMARILYRGNVDFEPRLTGAVDFNTASPSAPAAATDEVTDTWGTGLWGAMVWGQGGTKIAKSRWKKVNGVGDEVSIWVAAGSNRSTAPDIEIIGAEYLFEEGAPL